MGLEIEKEKERIKRDKNKIDLDGQVVSKRLRTRESREEMAIFLDYKEIKLELLEGCTRHSLFLSERI